MSKEKAKVHINNVSKMIGSKRIKLSEGMAIHIQNELVLALKELEDWKMSVLISPEAYKKLLQGDLNWLFKQPESLEKDHIEAILKNLIKRIEEGKEF